jgi:hypothetical protein
MADIKTDAVIAFLNSKWGNRSCPMCNKGPWSVQDRVFQLNEFHQGNLVVGGPLIPVIPVSCGNCGHTVLVNAIIAGVLPAEPLQADEKS